MSKIIGICWLGVGFALAISSVLQLLYVLYPAANLVILSISLLSFAGGIGLILEKKLWPRILIAFIASLALLYGAAYVLLGGFEDEGPKYTIIVFFVCGLSIVSVVTLFFRWLDG